MFRAFRKFIKRLTRRSVYSCDKKTNNANILNNLDLRTQKNIKSLNPKVQNEFIKLLQIAKKIGKTYGVNIKAISGHRSYSEQGALFAQGRTAPGKIVTYARPGYSNHNFGTALDLGCFDKKGKYLDSTNPTMVGKIYKGIFNNAEAEGLKIEWGGNWKKIKDTPHFEYQTNLTMAQMRERKKHNLPIV